MIYISLPDERVRRLSFYLAMEEYVARFIDEEHCFFYWQVEPSVIFGRNQLIENEVNTGYCRSRGIGMFRRKSGGGCVYADMNNLMFSYITKEENVGFVFNRYINMVIHTLRSLGVEVTTSGRNDIMVDGRKVSGNAFYHIPGRSIVHGTMLYDTDIENMTKSITPSDEKLISKGISSVRQHIALLKDYLNMGLEDFKRYVRADLCHGELTLGGDEISKIEEIEKEYLSPEFIYGNNPRHSLLKKGRIENAGEFEISLEVKNGIIKKADMHGDYFITGEVDRGIIDRLRGVPLDRDEIAKALPERLDGIIMNLGKEDFINLITT